MSHPTTATLPPLYKGLALFTPGGDLVYGIDPSKQGRWHIQLCVALQDALNLAEPPLFLTPCYTATIDRWLDPYTHQLQISAEVYPRIWQYRMLLNALFDMDTCVWRMIDTPEAMCDPLVLLSYRQHWPQLWQNHDLLLKVESPSNQGADLSIASINSSPPEQKRSTPAKKRYNMALPDNTSVPSWGATVDSPSGYVLRLFVAGHNSHIVTILEGLHQLLEDVLSCPYTLKVIDVIKQPELAEADQILATPTLVKVWPEPTRHLVGALDQPEKILQLLDPETAGS